MIAILLGIGLRTAWAPGERFRAGIAFSAKQLLEIAVTLLGASLSLTTIRPPAPPCSPASSPPWPSPSRPAGLSRLLGLPTRWPS